MIRAVGVVVPAHDEEDLLPLCLASLHEAAQALRGTEVHLVVVADACRDLTAQVARRGQAGERPFDFPELTDYKRLQNLARSVSDEGRRWGDDRKDEFFTAFREHPELSREIAKMMEQDNSRGDQRLSIVCLPLTGVVGLKVGEGLLIISYEMYRSHEVFVRWLGEAINQ